MVKTLLAEYLFVTGEIILIIALIVFGLILKKLLRLLRKPSIFWIILLVSSFFMLLAMVFHFISISETGSIEDPVDLMRNLGRIGILEGITLLVSAVFAVLAGGMYFRWSHR